MKRLKMKTLFLTITLLLSMPSFNVAKTNFVKAASLYPSSSLGTIINLNDCTESEVRSYYSALNSLSNSEKQGENLLKNLKPILSNNQKYYKYDNDNNIWKMYEIIDRDWEKSPASEITFGTYNASTNTITDYEYGSMSVKKNNPYLHALYVDRSIDNPKTAWDSHGSRNETPNIEREHIWPKSHGFDSGTGAGARGDPMHLWAADGGANGIHSNYFYGNVDTTKTYTNSHDKYAWTGNNYLGFSKSFSDSTAKVFEPQDCDKGDIARACFYMVARYNNIAGNDDAIDSDNPNLCLANDVSKSEETGTSSATTPYALGVLKDLLEWNKLDPVDDFEIHRNNLLFNNYTNNRNPFIDFPEWADLIWGEDSTTKVANPQSDELYQGGEFVPPVDNPDDVTPVDNPTTDPEDDNGIKLIDENGLYFGILKPLYFYIIVGVAALLLLIIIIAIMRNSSKKDRKQIKKRAQKMLKGNKGKRK